MTYKFLIDNIKEIVFRIDRNGTIEYLNKSWTEMTGFDLEESKENLLTDYIHCEDKKRYGDLYQWTLENKKEFYKLKLRCLTKENEEQLEL